MSTGAIVAIVIGVLIVLALVMLLARSGRQRKLESNRVEAREIRREAEVRSAEAEQAEAEAQESAARARREQAVADQEAARAADVRDTAREHHERADAIDPDAPSSVEEQARTEEERRAT